VADLDDAYAVFFRSEYRSVVRTASLIVRDPQRAEDLAQDAFVQLYRHWTKVCSYERPDAWVRRITIRLAVRDLERSRRRRSLEPAAPPPATAASVDVDVLDAVRRLPSMQRAAIALFYLEDLPVAQIADLLGISVSTCTVHLTRGRRRLADLLGSGVTDEVEDRDPSVPPPPATRPIEGTWRSVLSPRGLERRGFTATQIHRLQLQDGWSERQVNEIRIDGKRWALWQGGDGAAPAPTTLDHGPVRVTARRLRMEYDTCYFVLSYRLHGDTVELALVRSTCDQDPIEPIPDFMYAAVFGGPFERSDRDAPPEVAASSG
jgi:RNA polymerase sigma-70 factor (ECF subfamily)